MSDWLAEFDNILSDYETELTRVADDEIKKTARAAAKDLRASSALFKTNSKGYAKGWTVKNNESIYSSSYIVHNKKHYRLTHLLENGHAMVVHGKHAGRVRAIKHIEPIAKKHIKELHERLEKRLK